MIPKKSKEKNIQSAFLYAYSFYFLLFAVSILLGIQFLTEK